MSQICLEYPYIFNNVRLVSVLNGVQLYSDTSRSVLLCHKQTNKRNTPSNTRHFNATNVVGSKSFRPDIQKPRQMENAVRDI